MKNPFLWTYSAILDEKNRIVLPAALRKNIAKGQDDLVLVLSKSWSDRYIKIIEDNLISNTMEPLKCDSLNLLDSYRYFPASINPKTWRLALKKEILEWLFDVDLKNNFDRKLTIVGLVNHIIITTKNIAEILK